MKGETTLPRARTDRRSIIIIAEDALTTRIVRAVCRIGRHATDCLSSCELGGIDMTVSLLAAADHRQQLVLIHLPRGGDDISAAKQLRVRGFTGPVVALTNDGDHKSYIDAGVDDCLRSPIQPYELLSLMEKHL